MDASTRHAESPAVPRLSTSLRIMGADLDPEKITELLGLSPTFAARKGAQVRRGSREITQRIGIWMLEAPDDASPEWGLDDAIVALLAKLPSDVAIWRDLAKDYQIDVFCGLFMGCDNQGTDLRPSTLQLLAERHLSLGLDIYGPCSDDEAT